jgi:hypothetical protein
MVRNARQSGRRPLFSGLLSGRCRGRLGQLGDHRDERLGGFAMAASPAIVQFVGGPPTDATANSKRVLSITLGSNPALRCRLSISARRPLALMRGLWSIRAYSRSSTLVLPIGKQASAKLAPASPRHRWRVSPHRSPPTSLRGRRVRYIRHEPLSQSSLLEATRSCAMPRMIRWQTSTIPSPTPFDRS